MITRKMRKLIEQQIHDCKISKIYDYIFFGLSFGFIIFLLGYLILSFINGGLL